MFDYRAVQGRGFERTLKDKNSYPNTMDVKPIAFVEYFIQDSMKNKHLPQKIVQEIFEAKKKRRLKLTSLPFPEKIRILLIMQKAAKSLKCAKKSQRI